MKLRQVSDIPEHWTILNVRKKSTVKIRPCNGVETFKVSWQDAELVSDPKVDLIVIQPNGKEYPIKKDIFWETYEWTDWNTLMVSSIRQYRKTATTKLVKIPEGVTVEIETLEGVLSAVSYPDFIAIGSHGELYANTLEFFNENLEVV